MDTLEFHFQNKKPVSLEDLALSMKAVNDEFRSFCSKIDAKAEAKLFVSEVREGSIVIDLISSVVALMPLADNVNAVVEFSKHLKDLYDYLSGKSQASPKFADRATYANYSRIVRPTVMDKGSRLTVVVKDSPGTVTNVVLDGSDADMEGSSDRSDMLLEALPGANAEFREKATLLLTQIRNDDSGVGDRGIVIAVSKKPRKLVVMDQAFKDSVVKGAENAFEYGYVVDVEVERLNEKIIDYRVVKFHERFLLDGE